MKSLPRLLVVSVLSLGLFASARAAVETFTIDPVHSRAGFTLRHMVSRFTGSFTKVTGTLTVDREALEKSSVVASIDIGSLNTASDKRDTHVKSPDFFDFAKFPTMTFKSKSWKKTGADTYDVTGDLTGHAQQGARR
jgi:polyisoprenoid-binding protein YceI